MPTPLLIRPEASSDGPALRALNRAAFGTPAEADLVDRLRDECTDRLLLVGERGGVAVGYALFTPVVVEGDRKAAGMGLAPMAVAPSHQRTGVGTALVRAGLELLAGIPFVVVLGHADYYPRFGFERASAYGLRCAYAGVPDEAFMVRVFRAEALAGVAGVVHYHPAFGGAV